MNNQITDESICYSQIQSLHRIIASLEEAIKADVDNHDYSDIARKVEVIESSNQSIKRIETRLHKADL